MTIETERAVIVLAVRKLFDAIRAGKVHFSETGVPQTIAEVEAVRFDEAGDPIYESIGPMVRTLARSYVGHLMADRETKSPVHDYLGEAVPVNEAVLQQCREKQSFEPVSFELYKETVRVLSVAAHAFFGDEPGEFALPRNQAICAGLLVRIAKLMVVSSKVMLEGHGEVIMILNRSVMESATNLRFLVLKNEERFFDQFVSFSLAPERELYDVIQKNIADRGGEVLPIEQGMLRSIDDVCKSSGLVITNVPAKTGDWGGGLRSRLDALGEGDRYAGYQRVLSHAVHGTWVDLVMRHLDEVEGGFRPAPRWLTVDCRQMLPICILALDAARAYLDRFFPRVPELEPLYERMDDLEARVVAVNNTHEVWLRED